jgi:hypothetical protein
MPVIKSDRAGGVKLFDSQVGTGARLLEPFSAGAEGVSHTPWRSAQVDGGERRG